MNTKEVCNEDLRKLDQQLDSVSKEVNSYFKENAEKIATLHSIQQGLVHNYTDNIQENCDLLANMLKYFDDTEKDLELLGDLEQRLSEQRKRCEGIAEKLNLNID